MNENIRLLTSKDYRIKKSMRVLIVITTLVIVIISVFFAIIPFLLGKANDILLTISCVLIGFGFAAFFIYLAISRLKYRIMFDNEGFNISSINKIKRINYSKINGFIYTSITDLVLYSSDKKRLATIYSDTENFDEIYKWVKENYNNFFE